MEERLEDQLKDLLSLAMSKDEKPEVQVLPAKTNPKVEVDIFKSSLQFLSDYSRLLLPQLTLILPDLVMAGFKYWLDNHQSRQDSTAGKSSKASSSSVSKSSKQTNSKPKSKPRPRPTPRPTPTSTLRSSLRATSSPPKKNTQRQSAPSRNTPTSTLTTSTPPKRTPKQSNKFVYSAYQSTPPLSNWWFPRT